MSIDRTKVASRGRPQPPLFVWSWRALLAVLTLCVQIAVPIGPAFAREDVSASGAESPPVSSETSPREEEREVAEEQTSNSSPRAKEVDRADAAPSEIVESEPALVANTDTQHDGVDEREDGATSLGVPELTPPEPLSDSAVRVSDEATPQELLSHDRERGGEGVFTESDPIDDIQVPILQDGDGSVSIDEVPSPIAPDVRDPVLEESDIPLDTLALDDTEGQESEGVTDEVSPPDDAPPEPTPVSTTTEHTVVMPELHAVAPDETYAFSPSECVRVDDGAFYCSDSDTGEASVLTEGVSALPDQDGDMEIFVTRGEELTQLTFNVYDDGAPFYDQRSNSIVFHRLIEARYQIIALDLETGREEQLTFDSYNNMEPSRFGDVTVWQGWVGNDWEIFVREGSDVRMVSDNTIQDIGPVINGDFVIWQSESEGTPTVMVYNVRTKAIESIPGEAGTAVMNPRMVLVYDAEDVNGDTFTYGYDLKEKRVEPLSASARPVPHELPDPEQGGEERALITQVTQLKTKTEDDRGDGDDDLLGEVPEDTTLPLTTASTSPTDLVIPPVGESASSTIGDPAPTPDHDIPDLVITVPVGSDDDSTGPVEEMPRVDHIPDIVVPPFDETISTTHGEIDIAETR